MQVHLSADTLEYLKKGGRLSAAQAAIGIAPKRKARPGTGDGSLKAVAKVRGRAKALNTLLTAFRMIGKYCSAAYTVS